MEIRESYTLSYTKILKNHTYPAGHPRIGYDYIGEPPDPYLSSKMYYLGGAQLKSF